MTHKIDSKAKRERLAKRREPYWHKLVAGGYLGYRVGSTGGSWIARYRVNGKQKYKSLTLPPHLPQNEYDTAITEAKSWFDGINQGNRPAPGTIGEAAQKYIKKLERDNGARAAADARGRIDLHITPHFGNVLLERISSDDIEDWHESFLVDGSEDEIRKSKATANRNLTTLKAMLNHALKGGLITSDRAWRFVSKFKGAEAARPECLKSAEIKKLLDAAEHHFKTLILAGILTGARYGELAKLRVKHVDKKNSVLNIPRGKTEPRLFPLSQRAKAFFVEQAKGKTPEAFLLTKDGEKPWGHSDQTKLMRAAVSKAGLPDGVVFYTLRHSFISDLIGEMSVFEIAKITGTSIAMIEKHYGKQDDDRIRGVLERSSLA